GIFSSMETSLVSLGAMDIIWLGSAIQSALECANVPFGEKTLTPRLSRTQSSMRVLKSYALSEALVNVSICRTVSPGFPVKNMRDGDKEMFCPRRSDGRPIASKRMACRPIPFHIFSIQIRVERFIE